VEHVRLGLKWFRWVAARRRERAGATASGEADHVALFHDIVRRCHNGPLRPPFNHEARETAGMGQEWYMPLAAPGPGEGGAPGETE
jgi:uncharacterized ferritin-like protein (DUF455 family)